MEKINGLEDTDQLPPKVCRMYRAVLQMLEEGTDASKIRVSTITERAGIGKGTAYEYFESREEIVGCAIVYQVKTMFGWLERVMEEQGCFQNQLNFLLEEVEKREDHKKCFLRIVHMMTDTSDFNRKIQEKMCVEELKSYFPLNVFGRILQQGVERGELRGDLPLDYMVHCLFAHLLTYMTAVTSGRYLCTEPETLRALVYRGVMNELAVKTE